LSRDIADKAQALKKWVLSNWCLCSSSLFR